MSTLASVTQAIRPPKRCKQPYNIRHEVRSTRPLVVKKYKSQARPSVSSSTPTTDQVYEKMVLHYDEQTRRSRGFSRRPIHYQKQRQNSAIGPLRLLCNFMKSALFYKYVPKNAVAVDACSGRGGDIGKWDKEEVQQVLFVEAAPVATQEARRRYGERRCSFQATFLAANMFEASLAQLPEFQAIIQRCDVVSCQFALHYAFQTEAHLRRLLFHVSQLLKPGGVFFGITTDATQIQAFYQKHKIHGTTTAQTSVCTIQAQQHFLPATHQNSNSEESKSTEDTSSVFGRAYQFTLQGGEGVDQCVEYLVDQDALQDWATSYGLHLESSQGLEELYHDIEKPLTPLRFVMKVPEMNTIPQDQQEVFRLYRMFVFRRTTQQNIVY